jgi:ABC-2 type transport system permease protein
MATRSLRWEANAFVGFLERQKNLYKRYWAWEVVWILYTLVTTLSIGYLASGLQTLGFQQSPAALKAAQLYLLIGAMLWSYLSMVFVEVAWTISWERWEGTIEYTMMAPVKRATHLLGVSTFSIFYALARAGLIGVIVVLLFGLDLSRADLLSGGLVLGAATLPLIGLGILTCLLPLLSPEKGDQMTVAVQGILLLVSGVYYPVSVLPGPLQALGFVSPLTYTLTGMREALLRHKGVIEMLPTLGLLLLMGAVLIPVGLWIFGLAERRAKRLGLLKRSG